ncbi:MAG: hypothetical protein HQL33_09380 [Alphaproteobacteria bacterium]|nr:hypothetical protein [Alphaproteobacteria bacterium]
MSWEPGPPLHMPQRNFVFSPKDEAAYDALLHAAFPGIRYYDWLKHGEDSKPDPPELRLVGALAECQGPYVNVILDPDWRPTWQQSPNHKTTCWVSDLPYPNATIERSRACLEASVMVINHKTCPIPPGIDEGRVYFRCLKDEKTQRSLAAKAIRLIGKVATNRNVLVVNYPSLEVRWKLETGGPYWFGFDALDWCRQDPERMLAFRGYQGYGFRPAD